MGTGVGAGVSVGAGGVGTGVSSGTAVAVGAGVSAGTAVAVGAVVGLTVASGVAVGAVGDGYVTKSLTYASSAGSASAMPVHPSAIAVDNMRQIMRRNIISLQNVRPHKSGAYNVICYY